MAYIKLNNGNIKSVDDDELKALILTGAGEETDSPTTIPSLPTAGNENGQTTLEPIPQDNQTVLSPTLTTPRQLTAIPGAVIGGALGAAQGALTNTPNSFDEGFKQTYKQGLNNEGLAGVVANPLNVVQYMVPALSGEF